MVTDDTSNVKSIRQNVGKFFFRIFQRRFVLSFNIQSFTLWWNHISSEGDTNPGIRLSWYVDTQVLSDDMELISSGKS